VRSNLIATEVAHFQEASGTVLFADLPQQFAATGSAAAKAGGAFGGMVGAEPRVPRGFRLADAGRRAARCALGESRRGRSGRGNRAGKSPGRAGTKAAPRRLRCQFFDWSTSLPAVIQGIMPRSLAPTSSIW